MASHIAQIETKNRRKANLDRIRNSMREFGVIKQNQTLALTRLREIKAGVCDGEEVSSSSPGSEKLRSVGRFEVFDAKYQLLQKLGEGSNGVVHRCVRRQTGREFAVKSFRFQEQHLPGLKANFLVMKNLRHPSIISYEALYFDLKKRLGWLVMQLVRALPLSEVQLDDEEQRKSVMFQVLSGLEYLHRRDVVHRDIKPENILYNPVSKTVKIIDFGISRRFRRRGVLFDMWTITGTLYYRAPEMFCGGYREGVDVWAAGVMLYKMIWGVTPFESEYHSQTIQNIQSGELVFPEEFGKCSYEVKSLLRRMLNRNSEERPTAGACLRDGWFSSLVQKGGKQSKLSKTKENRESSVMHEPKLSRGISCGVKSEMSMRTDSSSSELRERGVNWLRPCVGRAFGDEFHCIEEQV